MVCYNADTIKLFLFLFNARMTMELSMPDTRVYLKMTLRSARQQSCQTFSFQVIMRYFSMDAGFDGLASVTYLLSAVQLKLARGQSMTDVDVCVHGANCRQRDYANCWV